MRRGDGRARRAPAGAALLAALLLAGCAGLGGRGFAGREVTPPFADPGLTVPVAASLLTIGQSRKPDVQARLGPAEAVRFDTGYEAWVYRAKGEGDARTRPELVLLFDPSGVLAKLRARPGYGSAEAAQ